MRRVKIDGTYKMRKFTDNELKMYITNAVKPISDISDNVEDLLKELL